MWIPTYALCALVMTRYSLEANGLTDAFASRESVATAPSKRRASTEVIVDVKLPISSSVHDARSLKAKPGPASSMILRS